MKKTGVVFFVVEIIMYFKFGFDVYPNLFHWHLYWVIINKYPC